MEMKRRTNRQPWQTRSTDRGLLDLGDEPSQVFAPTCSTINGVDVTNRKSISTGEVPKLNSKQPSTIKASQAARAPSTIQLCSRATWGRILSECQHNAAMSHIQAARQGK